MPPIIKPTPVDVNTPAPTPIGPLDRAPAPVDVGTPVVTPIGPPDRAPAPVAPGPGLGVSAGNPVPATLPVQEAAVDPNVGSVVVPDVVYTVPSYIEVLLSGNTVVQNATAIDFTGSGVTASANGTVATVTITSGGTYGNSNVSTLLAGFGSNTITTTGNVTAGYVFGNGSQLTGITTTYSNSNVTTLLASLGANTISGTGNITTTANISGGFILGNGSLLSGIAASYGNANVVANLAALGSNPISTTGNITGGNILGGANVNATTHTGTTVSVSANVTGGNITTAGLIVTTGNVSGGNVIAATLVQSATVSASGNVTGGNILTAGIVSATGNVSGNFFIGNGSQLTGINNSFAGEMHVSKNGNDSTGTGNILQPYLTITHALTQVTGGRNTIVIHPGGYTENPTITSQATQLITYDATGASTLVDGTVTIANVTGRIAGLKMTNLAITGNAQAYINSSTVDGQFTKSSSGYVEVDDCELQVTGNVLISGSGSISIVGNKINNLVVNNAGAAVLVKGADDCVMPQVTAGSLNIVDSIIRASSNTANAVTASAGTVVTLMNNQIVTPAADNVARVSIAGYHSIISVVYDKANSTLSNSLNSVAYFQTANVDSLVSSGNITGGNVLTAGYVSATGNITGNFFVGNGSLLTGIAASSYGNANVVANLAALGSNPISTTGNITAGNILFGIFNLLGNGDAQVGNLTVSNGPGVGNLVVGNIISATGNILTGGNVSATANVTGGNLTTGGLISATGNITGGNLTVGSGTITGGNVNGAVFNGNVAFGTGTVGGSGNITGGNIAVSGVLLSTNTVSATGNITGGNLTTAGLTSTASLSVTGNTATVTTANYSIGYLNVPQVSLSANSTTALTDSGKHYYSVSASNLSLTIANNTSVAWPVGTAITVVNAGTASILINQGTGVSMYQAGNATAGNRVLATFGMATIMNTAANTWFINGTGLS